jgi:integrase
MTVRHIRATLRRALADAVRDGLVIRNAAADARPPHVPHRPIAYLTPANLRHLIVGTADHPHGPLFALAATTGLRLGELLGLSWADVSGGSLTVRRSLAKAADGGWAVAEPKTVRSIRTIPLPTEARRALDMQQSRQLFARKAAGATWQGESGLVFTDAIGRPLKPESVSREFSKARARLGIPAVRFHDLRHSAATTMLAEGVPLAVISEWLGHASITITATHYAAVVPALRDQAAEAMDRALSAG